jgi:RNA polymerase sigma-70 factor (ECF subfamily)
VNEDVETDEALMARYVAGDRRAFERLYRRLAPRVHGFFLRSFGSPAVADDLLQQTFLKLHRARRDWRQDAPLRPWLFTIAARVRLDELRRRYHLAETADDDAIERAAETSALAEQPVAAANDDLVAEVRAALARLPESQRAVVHLHRYEGMTFGEIARVLGTTEGAIKLRAFRAYERLRVELAGVLGKEEAA